MKKSIFLFFAAILCSVSAWAYNLPANYYIYFEKPTSWTQACLLIGKSSYSEGRQMTKISNTNLYCWTTVKWDGYTEYFFMQDKWGGENSSPTHRNQYAGSNKTAVFKTEFKKYHLFTTAGSKKTSTSSYDAAVNLTQTIQVQLQDGSNWVDATTAPADLTASTYALTSATAAGAKSANITAGSSTVSTTVSGAYSATVTLACANVTDGYVFEGWYDSNGNKITSYTISAATTVYARFIETAEETNEVSITYMCGTTSVATAVNEYVGVESEKSFTAPTVTGYQFKNWTVGAGMTLKTGAATDATIGVVTQSASSDYTLVANYEEVMETVYFINTNKWARVNIHKWGGTAAGSSWPGEQLTASGEKIGGYDVYSYTAKQGDYANVIFNSKTSSTDSGNDQTADLDWTAGKYYIHKYNGNTGWYTQAEAEALLVAPIVYEKVYFVNNKNWSLVQIHAWKGSDNNGWPGQALTATGETVAGFDVYSFEAAKGTYTNLLFNNKVDNNGVQSNNFVWTDGKYYYMGADADYAGGTKEEVADEVAVEIPQETVYFINTGEWKGVNIYGWDGTVAMGWPGTAMNETSEVVNGKEGKVFKVYSHSADQGAYKNIKFNNTENNDTQSSNLEWKNGKYYALATDKWYDDLATAEADLNIYNIKLAGSMTKWADEAKEFAVTGTTGTLTITLTAGVHEFKIIEDGTWKGNSGTMTRGNRTDWTFDSGDNAKIFAEVAGDYTFSWDATTDKLTVVTYPNSYPAISIVGTMNEWNKDANQSNVVTDEKTSISIDLEAGKLHEFKVAIDTIMLGNEGTMIKSETDWTFEWHKGNAKLTTQAEGTYVFTWNHATHKLSVEYPATTEPLNKLTYTVTVPAGTQKCYIAGDMTSWAFKEMTNKGNNVFSIEIEGAIEAHKYKYSASDSWAHQEVKADGSNVDNRTYNAQDVVEKWAEPLVYTVKVPAGTKKCFLAGDMNGWSFTEMTDMGNNTFSIEYGTATTEDKYKYACKADWAYEEKKNGNVGVDNRTYNANDVVERWNRIDISDGENAAIIGSHAGKGKVEVYVDRELKAGELYTISLPFAVASAEGLFGSGTVVYEYAELKYEDDEYALYFDNTKTAMEAGKPYLVKPGSDRNGFEYKNTNVIFKEEAIEKTVNNTTISMKAVMSVSGNATTNGAYWLASDKCLYNASTALKSLRAVFNIQSNKANVRARVAFGENVETGVDNIVTTDAPVKVIKNGQLIIIRDGVKYNVQGQKL